MGLFSKKKPQVITFNRDELQYSADQIMRKIGEMKEDPCLKMIVELVKIARNIAILDCSSSRNEEERIKDQGKLKAYDEFQIFIEHSINRASMNKREGKKPVTGTINAYRRVSNQADSSI